MSDLKQEFFEFIGARLQAQLEASMKRIEHALTRIGEQLTAQSTALSRLQADNEATKAQIAELQANFQTQSDAINAANARLQKSIDDLKNAAGNDDALNAIATDQEAALGSLKAISEGMAASATSEGGLDQPPATQVAITPPSASLAPGGTQAFSSSVPSAWAATSGSIDANGNYTAPSDPSIIGDDVTATPLDTTVSAATAHVTIG